MIERFLKSVSYLWHRWLPLRLSQLRQALTTPVRLPKPPKRLPLWAVIVLVACLLALLAWLLAPRPIAHSAYSMFRSLPEPVITEAYAIEERELRASGYYVGFCTYGVSLQIDVPQDWGNAETWDNRAREDGWQVDRTPEIGGVAQDEYGTSGSGHVGVVIDIQGENILIREMNYEGWNIMSERWTTAEDWDNFISKGVN